MLLAFETSAKAAGVALMDKGFLLGESYQNTGLTHSQTLMQMAEDLLKTCGKTPDDITAVAVAAGPGSFTGVRIGVAAAKGFAWGRELPLYGVSTLEAMARGLGMYNGLVLCTMDARRDQTYTALFRFADGEMTRMLEDQAISFAELENLIKNYEEPIFLVGDGSILCYNTLKAAVPQLVLPPEHKMHQRGVGVALAAMAQIAEGKPGDGDSLAPNYLRLSQAERERLARENR